jgi:esterase/lipase superfamily enzyme
MSFDWRNITLPEMRQEWTWRSPSLDRDMSVARWGYFGKPLLLFPTAGGDFLECERFMLVKSIQHLVQAGKIKVYACGSITGDGWLNPDASPRHRTWLQARFDEYLVRELLPFVKKECGNTDQKIAVAGASLGAYNALNAVTKHPEWIDLAICMSGTYDFKRWMNGQFDEDYYFNMPLHFLGAMPEGRQLDELRVARILLASGQGRAEAAWESEWIAALLRQKGVKHWCEIWGKDVHHDWPTWRHMLPMFLEKVL